MVGAACGGTHAIPAATKPGIAITVYQVGERSYGVVDDRRVVAVAGGTILLDRIDGAAPLQALVIEPLGNPGALRVTACARENLGIRREAGLPSPLVRCKSSRGGSVPCASCRSRPHSRFTRGTRS